MEQINVINNKGEVVNNFPLNSGVWEIPLSRWNISLVNRYYLANQRQGTKKTKRKGEVAGGGIKPWRQKGTGRARSGSIRNPQFRGGGVAFGPTGKENYSLDINKKFKKKVFQSLLGEKMRQQKLIIIDQITLDNYKAQEAEKLLTNLLHKDLKPQIEKLKQEVKALKIISKRTNEQEKELTEKEKELTKLEKKLKQKIKTLLILAADGENKQKEIEQETNQNENQNLTEFRIQTVQLIKTELSKNPPLLESELTNLNWEVQINQTESKNAITNIYDQVLVDIKNIRKKKTICSFRNLPYVNISDSKSVNFQQVFSSNYLIFTQPAFSEIEERLS